MASQQISSATSFKNPKLVAINDVEIDKSGKFKYILIKVHDPDKDREFKFIVRGTSKASYHGELILFLFLREMAVGSGGSGVSRLETFFSFLFDHCVMQPADKPCSKS